MCGAAGSPVAMKDLQCAGGEFSIDECTWSAPDAACAAHELDSVVFCGKTDALTGEGTARLLSSDGAPSLSGAGLLQIYHDGVWTPVCGLTPGAASVACKTMGFAGASVSGAAAQSSTNAEIPLLGNLHCDGSESSVTDCSFEQGDDVYCAPSEAAVVSCAGDGDSTGQPAKLPAPA